RDGAVHADRAPVDGDLDDQRDEAAERLVDGDPAGAARWKRSRARLLRGEIERAERARVRLQEAVAVLDRVDARGVRELVDETLDCERRVRVPDGAPPEDGDGAAGRVQRDEPVGEVCQP